MNKPLSQRLLALFICVVTAAGCSSSPGPDAMTGKGGGQCTACHAPGNLVGSVDPLTTNGTGTFGKHVAHVTSMGFSCDTCHFNYTSLSTHTNGTLDTTNPVVAVVYFDIATNPTGTWNNALGRCSSLNCHGTDTLNWYGTSADMATYQSCTSCHTYPLGTRRRVTGSGGDFGLNPAIVSNHVTTTGDPAPTQCLVCHDHTSHSLGTVQLKNADNGAAIIVYNPALPASLEPFCLSCHDADGALATSLAGAASPFNDGVSLGSGKNVAGNKIQSYWNGLNNRHRSPPSSVDALTCAGTGIAGTGCHGRAGAINMHGSVNKGLLTNNLTLGVASAVASSASYTTDYKLCFDCHSGYPAVSPQVVLGYKRGGNYDFTGVVPLTSYSTPTAIIQSLFRDQFVTFGTGTPIYDDRISFPRSYNYLPLHNYHLLSVVTNTLYYPDANWLSWKYRGDAAQAGRITCVTCHNVHGTNGLSNRSTYDELGITSAVTGSDQYGSIGINNFITFPSPFESYPMNCAVDCHYMTSPNQTYYWNTPANE